MCKKEPDRTWRNNLDKLETLPFTFAALLLMFTTSFIVGVFYCVDALQGERRHRSILFWKSLPVSDLTTTVLSKASIPFAMLPQVTFAVTVVTQEIICSWEAQGCSEAV